MAVNSLLIRKILSLLAYVLAAILVAYLLIDRHPPTLGVGVAAPMETSITMLSGSSTTFKKLQKKPMVINFFATWCTPCLKEMPLLSKLAKQYSSKISFVGAAVASEKADIIALKNKFVLSYELGMVMDTAVNKWQAHALPTTYVIDMNGKILWAHSGILHEEQLEQAIQLAIGGGLYRTN